MYYNLFYPNDKSWMFSHFIAFTYTVLFFIKLKHFREKMPVWEDTVIPFPPISHPPLQKKKKKMTKEMKSKEQPVSAMKIKKRSIQVSDILRNFTRFRANGNKEYPGRFARR